MHAAGLADARRARCIPLHELASYCCDTTRHLRVTPHHAAHLAHLKVRRRCVVCVSVEDGALALSVRVPRGGTCVATGARLAASALRAEGEDALHALLSDHLADVVTAVAGR